MTPPSALGRGERRAASASAARSEDGGEEGDADRLAGSVVSVPGRTSSVGVVEPDEGESVWAGGAGVTAPGVCESAVFARTFFEDFLGRIINSVTR